MSDPELMFQDFEGLSPRVVLRIVRTPEILWEWLELDEAERLAFGAFADHWAATAPPSSSSGRRGKGNGTAARTSRNTSRRNAVDSRKTFHRGSSSTGRRHGNTTFATIISRGPTAGANHIFRRI